VYLLRRKIGDMQICKLHLGLYTLADHTGRVPYVPEIIKAKIFPDDPIKIEPLIKTLEEAKLLTIESKPLSIRLIPWPQFSRCTTGKGDQLQALGAGDPFEPVAITPELQKQRKKERDFKKIQKTGLTNLGKSPSFRIFIKAWPLPLTHFLMEANAWNVWKQLERAKGMMDISLVLQALKKYPPTGKMWPQTWLKKKLWRKGRSTAKCPICFDEGRIYGPRDDGSKGALPCPKCKK
jgi:hypothetical protein